MAVGSAVYDYIRQKYENQNVCFLAIDVNNTSKETIISRAMDWEISYPIAVNGDSTASAYDDPISSLLLIDTKGIVQDIVARFPTASLGDPRLDSTIQSVAGKIPPLLTVTVRCRRETGHYLTSGSSVDKRSRWITDLRGRSLDGERTIAAPQMVIDRVKRIRGVMRNR